MGVQTACLLHTPTGKITRCQVRAARGGQSAGGMSKMHARTTLICSGGVAGLFPVNKLSVS